MSADRKYLKDRPLKQGEIFVFAGQQEYRNNINPASRFFRERSGAEFAPGSFQSFPAKRIDSPERHGEDEKRGQRKTFCAGKLQRKRKGNIRRIWQNRQWSIILQYFDRKDSISLFGRIKRHAKGKDLSHKR